MIGTLVVPSVVLDHVNELDNVFAFLVLLTGFEGVFLAETSIHSNVRHAQTALTYFQPSNVLQHSQ